MLTAPDAGWTDFKLGSKETRYSLSYLTDIAVEWLDQAIHGLETLEPFSVHGFCEPGRMICTVSYWNCYIIFEGDDRNDKCESVYTVHENMIEFCRKLYSDIDSNLEEWVHWNDVYLNEEVEEAFKEAANRKKKALQSRLDTFQKLIADKSECFDEHHCFF